MSLGRMYLYAQLVAFLGFTGFGYAAPTRFATMLGMTLTDVTAIADFSATYGGLCAGISVLLYLGATRTSWERPALVLAVSATAGLLLGRVLTLLQHGPAGAYIHGTMAVELVAVVAGLWLLRADGQPAPSPGTA